MHADLFKIRIIDGELEYAEIFSKAGDAHFFGLFGFRFKQFSSAQAVMLSRSSCIADGEPWGATSEIVMSSTYF